MLATDLLVASASALSPGVAGLSCALPRAAVASPSLAQAAWGSAGPLGGERGLQLVSAVSVRL